MSQACVTGTVLLTHPQAPLVAASPPSTCVTGVSRGRFCCHILCPAAGALERAPTIRIRLYAYLIFTVTLNVLEAFLYNDVSFAVAVILIVYVPFLAPFFTLTLPLFRLSTFFLSFLATE